MIKYFRSDVLALQHKFRMDQGTIIDQKMNDGLFGSRKGLSQIDLQLSLLVHEEFFDSCSLENVISRVNGKWNNAK